MVRGKKTRLVLAGLLAGGLLGVAGFAQARPQDAREQQEDTGGQERDTLDPVDPFQAGTEEESGTGGAGQAGQDEGDPARPLNEREQLEDQGQLEDEGGSLEEEGPLDEPGTGGAGDTGTGDLGEEGLLDEDEGVFPPDVGEDGLSPREPLDGTRLPNNKGVR
jgi:hypothetical protein